MNKTIYEVGLDKNTANFQPLTPLSLLARAAQVFPDRLAIVHGAQRFTYAEYYARARKLASALTRLGVGPGDTVSVMLHNTPPMLEAHYGVPMTRAVLHSINTRLDAAIIGFMLDHANTKVIIADTEFAPVLREALAKTDVKPVIIEYSDPDLRGRRPARRAGLRGLHRRRRAGLRLADADRRMGRHRPELYLRHDRQPERRRLPSPRRLSSCARQCAGRQYRAAPGLSVDAADVSLQWLVLSLDGPGGGRRQCLPALCAAGRDLERACRRGRHASVRRADRDVDHPQRLRGPQAPARHQGPLPDRGRAAAGGRARGDERGRLRRGSCLRADRNLRPGGRQRVEGRVGRAGQRWPGGEEGAPGGALRAAGRPQPCSTPTRCSPCRPTARRSAR